MESFQEGSVGIDNVATGEDIGMTRDNLAITITTTITTGMFGRHCVVLPRLLLEDNVGCVEFAGADEAVAVSGRGLNLGT